MIVSKRAINAMHGLKIEQIRSLQNLRILLLTFHTVVIENVACTMVYCTLCMGAEPIAFL